MIDYGKRDLLGVPVDATDVEGAVERIAYFARRRRPYSVTALAVHGVIEATRDVTLEAGLADFDLVLPDGQPVRWAINLLHDLDLREKVPGPTVVDRLLEVAADEGWRVYFYGSTPETLAAIHTELAARFGGRLDVISTPSKFRPVDAREMDGIIDEINASGANVCFVGLGCPRQERFVAVAGSRLQMPALAVGAAFDYIAGNIERSPEILQHAGLEWLYRTAQEPRRLAPRYLDTNSHFLVAVARRYGVKIARRLMPSGGPSTSTGAQQVLIDA